MDRISCVARRSRFMIGCIAAVLLFALVACGGSSAPAPGGTGNTGTTPTAPPTATPVVAQGYGSSFGCPSDAVVKNAPSKASETVLPTNTNTTITAHNGDIVEVQLPFGHKWSNPTLDDQNVLQLQQPAGYAWKSSSACIWRFIARGTGVDKVTFEGQALCKKGQMCPMFVMVMTFTVNVK